MALTQAMLKAMGIEDDKREQILEAHAETLASIRTERDAYREKAEKVPALEKQIEEMAAESQDSGKWRQKYDEEHKAFEQYKAEVAEEKATAEKQKLYGDLMRELGVDEKRVARFVSLTDLADVDVTDGKIADIEKASAKIKADWGDFIVQKRTEGAQVDNPPQTDPTAFESMSLVEKMQFANDHPGDASVRAWLGK